MAFEIKVIDEIQCPRCNAWAEIRIDQGQMITESEMVLSFIVCPQCRLNQYYGTTTKKALKIISKIRKLKRRRDNLDENSPARHAINARISIMEKMQRKAETLF